MKVDRAYLEDIMNNKPYGFGKEFMKGKLKHFAYIAKPYRKVYDEPVRIEVMVTSESKAYDAARAQFYKEHPEYYREGSVEFYKAL